MSANQEEVNQNQEPIAEKTQHNKEWLEFSAVFESCQGPEEKLAKAIDFMQASISREGTPHFRNFWEARSLCLPLFKENIPPALRSHLWEQYDNLSKEARRLKEILDEQSAFAIEQIGMAIEAIETELQQGFNTAKLQLFELPDIPVVLRHEEQYHQIQEELNFLNVMATRINGLRKELIKTEMRIRQKNKLFQKLSEAGDLVFPRRKELIKQISDQFVDDVQLFLTENFESQSTQISIFKLREEVKALQYLAKILTLNTHAFSTTRLKLSECWDKLKEADKERKKERAVQKTVHKQNYDLIKEKIVALSSSFSEGTLTLDQAKRTLSDLAEEMRRTDLGFDEVKILKHELSLIRKDIDDRVRKEEQERLQHAQKKQQERQAKISHHQKTAQELLEQGDEISVEQLDQHREVMINELEDLCLSKFEKQIFDRVLKQMKDLISDKKQRALLNLSPDDQEAHNQLIQLLEQCKVDRIEVKDALKKYRRESDSAGLDLTQAMEYNAMIASEKERLDKINQTIQEIESKISNL